MGFWKISRFLNLNLPKQTLNIFSELIRVLTVFFFVENFHHSSIDFWRIFVLFFSLFRLLIFWQDKKFFPMNPNTSGDDDDQYEFKSNKTNHLSSLSFQRMDLSVEFLVIHSIWIFVKISTKQKKIFNFNWNQWLNHEPSTHWIRYNFVESNRLVRE